MEKKYCTAVVLAAGKGSRMGGKTAKQYMEIGGKPLVAYALARENEIKTVRIILSGKRTGMPEASIRERVREMYV